MQLIKTEYFRGNFSKNIPDKLQIIVKKEDGSKEVQVIENPDFSYYVTKPELFEQYPEKYNKINNFLNKEEVYKVECKYMSLFKSITETLDDPVITSYFRSSLASRNQIRSKLNQIHLDYRLHGTDKDIEDYFTYNFLEQHPYAKNSFGLSKCFFDIEVDGSQITGFPEPERAECPVNAITLVDINNKKIHSFVLSYEGNESYDEWLNNIESFKERIIKKYKKKTGIDFEIDIQIFDSEIMLIKSFFDLVNYIKPDFLVAWNADFDIPTLINRINNLGFDPTEICCPIEFKNKNCYYRIDNEQDLSTRSSTYQISGYTNYLDLMCLYANITKPMGKEESYSLDYIGEKITGMNKDEVVENMKTFHFADFGKFLEYNIQDTVMLAMIEVHTLHIDLAYIVSCITRTRLSKALKKTVCLKNLADEYAEKQGSVQSNNRARLYPKMEGKIKGAFVASPEPIAKIGMRIFEELSKFIFECCTDLDLASLYPSIIRALNISVETCIGKVYFDYMEYNGEDLVQDYMANDVIAFGSKYMNLPNVDDMIEIIDRKILKKEIV